MNLKQIKDYCVVRETYFTNFLGDKYLYIGVNQNEILLENNIGLILRFKENQIKGWKTEGQNILFD